MGGGNYMSNSKVKEPCKYFYLKIHISFFLVSFFNLKIKSICYIINILIYHLILKFLIIKYKL